MSISFHHRQTSFQLIKTLLATILSWPNTTVKSGSGYERAIQEHILLRAPYNNKYLIFSDHNPFSTRENAKNMLPMFQEYIKQYWSFLQIFSFRLSRERTMYICIIITTNNNYKIIQIHTLLILL